MMKRQSNYGESCWRNRTGLELALIAFVIIAVVFTIALVILLTIKIPSSKPNVCETSECTLESTQIAQRIDPIIHPCDDFYKFSCGNFLKEAHGNEKLAAFLSVQEDVQRQLIELYSEHFQENEHPMVTISKRVFQGCMDGNSIENDGLSTIKDVIRMLGGWPVVEGYWDETKFDWLQATYRIRELGYNFRIFLDLLVIPDPKDGKKNIFEVAIPIERNMFSITDFERKEYMVDVAVMFGAVRKHAQAEIMKTIEFSHELQQKNYSTMNINKEHRRFTLFEFYERYGHYINWFEFIDNIANTGIKISPNDIVVFPQLDILNKWLNLLTNTPKRIQANYMMWKIVEDSIPFLTEELQQGKFRKPPIPHLIQNTETRLEFCLRETQDRFVPSPINIMYARRYLTMEKKRHVEQMVQNIRKQFMHTLNNIDWMTESDKSNIIEKANDIRVTVGAPDDYLDDKVLDELKEDTGEVKEKTYLSILAHLSRSYTNRLFKKVNHLRQDAKMLQWYTGTLTDFVMYDIQDNMIRIPVTILQGIFFNENRPNYLNYGGIGTAIGYQFASLFSDEALQFDKNGRKIKGWSNETSQTFKMKMQCTILDLEYFNLGKSNFLPKAEMRETLALKLSYNAYKHWAAYNGEEARLIGCKYSPAQLFWIQASFITCKPTNLYDAIFHMSEDTDYFAFLVFGSMRNNIDFGRDFKCPLGSRMNPRDKCILVK